MLSGIDWLLAHVPDDSGIIHPLIALAFALLLAGQDRVKLGLEICRITAFTETGTEVPLTEPAPFWW